MAQRPSASSHDLNESAPPVEHSFNAEHVEPGYVILEVDNSVGKLKFRVDNSEEMMLQPENAEVPKTLATSVTALDTAAPHVPDLADLNEMRLGDVSRLAMDSGFSVDIVLASLNDDYPKKVLIDRILTKARPIQEQKNLLSFPAEVLRRYVLGLATSKDLRCFFSTSTAARQLEPEFPRKGGSHFVAAKHLLATLGCLSANTPVAQSVVIPREGNFYPPFDVWEGNYPMHAAAATGNLEAIMGLLGMGARLDQKNMFGYSALFWACSHDYLDVVTYLVRRGADKNSANGNGHTGLHVATMNGHTEIVSYLVRNGADKNYYDNRGNIPINVRGWRGGAREPKGEANRQVITAMLQ